MSRALNFLHITTFYPPYAFGGDAVYVQRLAHALGERGHHVDVIHCLDAYDLVASAPPELESTPHPNVVTHGLRSGVGWLSPLATHQTGWPHFKTRQIRAVLSSKRYDVVHYHNISLLGPGSLTLEAGNALKLYTTHEYWLVCPTHVLWKFNRRSCEKPECLRCSILAKRPPQTWRWSTLLTRGASHVDQFIAPSRFTARMHEERGFTRPFVVLPVFAERTDRDWQQPAPRPHGRPYFLYVGRLEVVKGPHTLFDVMAKVPDADLLVVGTGSQANRLRTLAAGNPRIHFLGAQSQRELGALYVHCLACLVPSLTVEPCPTVALEAFARKAPVIAHGLGGVTELVAQSDGGFVYKTDDELLSAMRQIAGSSESRRVLGENGYCAFTQRWSKKAHLERYLTLVNELAVRRFGDLPWRGTDDERTGDA